MDDARQKLTSYLLGELSEAEQTALEEAYFSDPELFDALATAEAELVDDYVRKRVDAPTRRRFEEHFLADPRRRERVRFAAALIAVADRDERPASINAATTASPVPWWSGWFNRRPAWAAALALVALGATAGWFVYGERRAEAPGTAPSAPPTVSRTPVVATLTVVIDSTTRAQTAGPAATLAVGPDTDQVRLNVTLRDADYASYRALLRSVGGAEIARRDEISRTGAAESTFTIVIPAGQVPSADYILTVQGRPTAGGFEDISQTILRVTRP
jgi:hypothetical protein